MNHEKCDAIQSYLEKEFPDSAIEQADIAGNQHYRIPVKGGLLMLRVGREFMEDHSKDELIEKLAQWKVPDLLRENKELGIVVTNYGPSTYQR